VHGQIFYPQMGTDYADFFGALPGLRVLRVGAAFHAAIL
jgi:hypothetical protein